MERDSIAAVQAAMADLQEDWAAALDTEQTTQERAAEERAAEERAAEERAAEERAAQERDTQERAAQERAAMRAEQDAEYEAVLVADMMRAPPPPPPPASGGIDMKVRFPDGTAEVFPFAAAACVCEVIQLAQARMGKSAPMAVHVRGQSAALDANWSLEMCGLTSPHVLVAAWI
jgi:hypothetical protein